MFKKAFILLTLLGFSNVQHALCCLCEVEPSPRTARQNASAVFSGEVISITPDVTPDQFSAKRVAFRVERIWKGVYWPTVSVLTSAYDSSCGIPFSIGTRYLVYADGRIGKLSCDACSRTSSFTNTHPDLEELGSGFSPFTIVVIEFGFLAVVITGIRQRRKQKNAARK